MDEQEKSPSEKTDGSSTVKVNVKSTRHKMEVEVPRAGNVKAVSNRHSYSAGSILIT